MFEIIADEEVTMFITTQSSQPIPAPATWSDTGVVRDRVGAIRPALRALLLSLFMCLVMANSAQAQIVLDVHGTYPNVAITARVEDNSVFMSNASGELLFERFSVAVQTFVQLEGPNGNGTPWTIHGRVQGDGGDAIDQAYLDLLRLTSGDGTPFQLDQANPLTSSITVVSGDVLALAEIDGLRTSVCIQPNFPAACQTIGTDVLVNYIVTNDCNKDGIPDELQLDSGTYLDSADFLDNIACPGGTLFPFNSLRSATGDVTVTVDVANEEISGVDHTIEVSANGVSLGILFAGAQSCSAMETLIIPAATWNGLLAGSTEMSILLERSAASCASSSCTSFSFATVTVEHLFDGDANNNGTPDDCLPDCSSNGPDSDGDGVPDDCDQCPGTIADASIVDAFGCPIHVAAVDLDADGDVEADDLAGLTTSLNGPDVATDPGQVLDTQADGDLDLRDVLELMRCGRGEDVAADPSCLGTELPVYRLFQTGGQITWTDANNYCRIVLGTHLAVVDKTSSVSQADQIAAMRALALLDPGIDCWFGLIYEICYVPVANGGGQAACHPLDRDWEWVNGPQLLSGDADYWSGAVTPEPYADIGSAYYGGMTSLSNPSYQWQNMVDSGGFFITHNFVAQLPPTTIPAAPQTTTQTVTVELLSLLDGTTVAGGTVVDWEIRASVSDGDNLGLSALVTDLIQDPGNPASLDLFPAESTAAAMLPFSAPDGFSNPDEGGTSGFFGVQRGTLGALDVVQIGGAMNTLGEALAIGPVGQASLVTAGIGQSMQGSVTVATGSFLLPSMPGTYSFSVANTAANVLDALPNSASAWEVAEAIIDVTGGTITLTVCSDEDGDGFLPIACGGTDCDDSDPTRFGGAPELCDGIDNDCDGSVPADELDGDMDGFSPCAGDCDDNDPSRSPAAPELCDGIDNDCDGGIPANEVDFDMDGVSVCGGDCDDSDPSRFPGAPELCDGIDNDCDGSIPADELDADMDGFSPCAGDCDDNDPTKFPGAVEVCDGVDNDCNGSIDEGFDADSDGTPDCSDGCPNDPLKTDPGACGCGVPDTDVDMDGVADCNDLCPNDPDPNQLDTDMDGVGDACDVCPNDFDPAQLDCDMDGVGDVCEIASGTQLDLNQNGTPDDCESLDFSVGCSGDGGDQVGCTDCPCMNNSPAGTLGGCLNSAGTSAALVASGSASVSLPSGDLTDLRFAISGAPGNAFCILNSGDAVAPGNPANPCFGLDSGAQAAAFDGLRCAITNTRRHGGRSADANGDVGVTNNPWGGEGGPPVGIAVAGGGFIAGQTRYFQAINRDDALAVCMRGLNTSQAIEVTFTP